MSFELREAELVDVEEIGAILDKAHVKDPLVSQLMASVDDKAKFAFWAGWLRGDFSKPGEKLFKMVELSSGYVHSCHPSISRLSFSMERGILGVNFNSKIVAFLKARYPAPRFEDPDEEQVAFPEGSNVELFNHWFENMDKYEDKHMDYEKDYCKP